MCVLCWVTIRLSEALQKLQIENRRLTFVFIFFFVKLQCCYILCIETYINMIQIPVKTTDVKNTPYFTEVEKKLQGFYPDIYLIL